MKAVFTGLEGSGKSLKLAQVAEGIAKRNAKWFKKTGVKRPIVSNLKLSNEFCNDAESHGVPIYYWSQLDELLTVKDADVFIDEIGNYFDARLWSDLSLDVRRYISQADKVGVEMYCTAQDFAQVDKAFRRLVTDLLWLVKVIGSRRPSATKPPIKYIWGIIATFRLDPQGYEEDKKKYVSHLPGLFLISRQFTSLFDTGQEIKGGNHSPLRHIERICTDERCLEHYGQPYRKIIHV